jgi:SAM-dependent methyltransferase
MGQRREDEPRTLSDEPETMSRRFDAAYYQRFYHDPDTRVLAQGDVERLVDFVLSYLAYLEIEVESVLDLGCGIGLWREALRRRLGQVDYTGVEVSEHVCRLYGWEHGSVVDYPADEPADLVVCQGVLQYLPARDARKAIRNLARLTSGALFLEVLTRADWEENCSKAVTDGDVYLRNADWYRSALRPHFVAIGGGVFVPREDGPVLYELERLE